MVTFVFLHCFDSLTPPCVFEDMKNNSGKRMKELVDELNAEKRRNQELLKEKQEKERENQILHAQLDSAHQQKQGAAAQPKRATEDNLQQAQSNVNATADAANMKLQMLSEQLKKLSMDNASWEKKAHSNELLAKEAQKEKEDLTR